MMEESGDALVSYHEKKEEITGGTVCSSINPNWPNARGLIPLYI
jgi:hypothetical protein